MSTKRKTKNRRILYLQPGGGEGIPLKVMEESPIGLTTEQVERLPYKYIKLNDGWDFPNEKIYLTLRGDIPITSYVNDTDQWMPITDFLEEVWGEHYTKMPLELKDRLLDLGVTVTVKPVDLTDEQEKKLTPYLVFQVMREHFVNVLTNWAKSEPRKDWKENIMNKVFLGLACAFGMYFLIKQGVV